MTNSHEQLIAKFYTAFREKDFRAMQQCYHGEIIFSDPVFKNLNGKEAKAMWHMLLSIGKDLQVTFKDIKADGQDGQCHWEATYTFSTTGRKVHNVIDATFEFRDGKIFRHTDQFNLWRWSRMALGISGLLLGWTPFMQNKIREQAKNNLKKFIGSHPEYQ